MSRPLMRYDVGQLEDLFARGNQGPMLLKQLESELQHRQVPRAVALPEGTPAPPAVMSAAILPGNHAALAACAMTVEDARNLLWTRSNATWESIEQARRELVQMSYPTHTSAMSAEARTQALAAARRVNEAYLTLRQARASGH
jgi:hypothetical protein